jgi:hypothetical protein
MGKSGNINITSKTDAGFEHIPPVIPKHVMSSAASGEPFLSIFQLHSLPPHQRSIRRMSLPTEVYSQATTFGDNPQQLTSNPKFQNTEILNFINTRKSLKKMKAPM